MASTLLLDLDNWDLCVDAAGNIAVASEPYSQAQDVASAARVWSGECYYDTSLGVPYADQILGQNIPTQILNASVAEAAQTVPGVQSAVAYVSIDAATRTMSGQIQITTGTGTETITL